MSAHPACFDAMACMMPGDCVRHGYCLADDSRNREDMGAQADPAPPVQHSSHCDYVNLSKGVCNCGAAERSMDGGRDQTGDEPGKSGAFEGGIPKRGSAVVTVSGRALQAAVTDHTAGAATPGPSTPSAPPAEGQEIVRRLRAMPVVINPANGATLTVGCDIRDALRLEAADKIERQNVALMAGMAANLKSTEFAHACLQRAEVAESRAAAMEAALKAADAMREGYMKVIKQLGFTHTTPDSVREYDDARAIASERAKGAE